MLSSSLAVPARAPLLEPMEPMRIVLYRHAPAETSDPQRWPDDLARPLTARGKARARRAARAIVQLEPGITHVLTSPAIRAHGTAEILCRALGASFEAGTMPSLVPGGSWRETLRVLAREAGDAVVVLVGHEPDLGKLAGVLLFGAPAAVPLKKAGACAIEAESPAAGAGRLRWLWSPGALRALARKRSKA